MRVDDNVKWNVFFSGVATSPQVRGRREEGKTSACDRELFRRSDRESKTWF